MSWRQVIHEVVDKLVSVLKKRKPTPVSPYFHFYHKFEYLWEDEQEKMEVAKECLEMWFASNEEPMEGEAESDWASFSPNICPQTMLSPGSQMKSTFHSSNGKSPIRDLDCLDLVDDPFQRV